MTELSFAKTFLQTLDSKPTKISADHVEDPRSYPSRSAYILPKMPRPFAKRQKLSSGQEPSFAVSLKSLRNPPLDVVLSSQSPTTSILNLKEQLGEKEGIPVEKIRLLYKKKPVGDSKVLKDLVGDEEGGDKIELTVMVMGGAASVVKRDEGKKDVFVDAPVAQGPSGQEVLNGDEFWVDLKGYLVQRLRDEGQGEKVFGLFKSAWESNSK